MVFFDNKELLLSPQKKLLSILQTCRPNMGKSENRSNQYCFTVAFYYDTKITPIVNIPGIIKSSSTGDLHLSKHP